MRRLVALLAVPLAACGGGFDLDEATARLATIMPPPGALENPIEPENVYQGGEWVEISGCCPAFVYRPDELHPDGWTGNGETLVARYFELPELADGAAACAAFLDWIGVNGVAGEPGCEPHEPVDGGTAITGIEGVGVTDREVLLGAVVTVEPDGARAVFTAITGD